MLARVYRELIPGLTETDYYARLAGHTDEHIFQRRRGADRRAGGPLQRARHRRLDRRRGDPRRGSLRGGARPVALVSAALRAEIDRCSRPAADRRLQRRRVAGRRDQRQAEPEPYLRAAELLGVPPEELLVFEDTDVGVASARDAGAYVVGLTRTIGMKRMGGADELIERIDVCVVERLLCS